MATKQIDDLKGVIVTPTERLLGSRTTTFTASSLRMCTPKIKNGHFRTFCLPDKYLRALKEKMKADAELFSNDTYAPNLFEAAAAILRRCQMLLDGRPRNEAECRYAVCNEIISLICNVFNYKVRLEETVKGETDYGEDEPTLEDFIPDISSLFGEQVPGPSETESVSTVMVTVQRWSSGVWNWVWGTCRGRVWAVSGGGEFNSPEHNDTVIRTYFVHACSRGKFVTYPLSFCRL